MTSGRRTAQTGDGPAESLLLEWDVPENATQTAGAREAVDALFAVVEGSIEPLGIELRLGCYDRETVSEADIDPANPYHLLVLEPREAHVSINPTYRALETRVPALSREAVSAFVEQTMLQPCGNPTRYEIGLADLVIRASQIALPPDWTDSDELWLDCYAGTVAIPVEHRDSRAHVSAPPARYLVHQPVEISVRNTIGGFRFALEVYWSPWVGEIARRGSPLLEGVARLEARGWNRT